MIQSKEITIVDISKIKPWPQNRNKHSKEQIERLANIINYQGFRNPIIVSNQSGYMVAGHGRYLAAKKLKLKKVPVIYQDFENDDQAYAFMVSDNAIASWAELDFSGINSDLENLGPDLDLDMLGIKNFTLDVSDKTEEEELTKPKKMTMLTCPNCNEEFEQQQAPKRYV